MAEGLHAFGHGGREGLCRERPWHRAGWERQETGSAVWPAEQDASSWTRSCPGAQRGPRGDVRAQENPQDCKFLQGTVGGVPFSLLHPLGPSMAQRTFPGYLLTQVGAPWTSSFSSSPDWGHAGSPRGVVLSLTAPLGARGQDL